MKMDGFVAALFFVLIICAFAFARYDDVARSRIGEPVARAARNVADNLDGPRASPRLEEGGYDYREEDRLLEAVEDPDAVRYRHDYGDKLPQRWDRGVYKENTAPEVKRDQARAARRARYDADASAGRYLAETERERDAYEFTRNKGVDELNHRWEREFAELRPAT